MARGLSLCYTLLLQKTGTVSAKTVWQFCLDAPLNNGYHLQALDERAFARAEWPGRRTRPYSYGRPSKGVT